MAIYSELRAERAANHLEHACQLEVQLSRLVQEVDATAVRQSWRD